MSEQALNPTPANKPAASEETRGITLTPPIDILETENEILVLADMPGVKPEDVDLRFENGELNVHGRRTGSDNTQSAKNWEASPTSYFRSFRITEHIAADKIEAEMKNGVLTLKLPKVEAVKPRRIAVKG